MNSVQQTPSNGNTQRLTEGQRRIRLSVSPHFHNKENRAPVHFSQKRQQHDNQWALARFSTVEWTVEQIARHITAGKAISVGAVKNDYRRQDNFLSSQIVGVDFDHGPDVQGVAAEAFASRHAFLIYATPSSKIDAPRSRALFILDQPISDKPRLRRLTKRLLYYYQQVGKEADKACKDPVRIFYGSATADYIFNAVAVLPVEVLDSLPEHPDERATEEAAKRRAQWKAQRRDDQHTQDYEHRYALKALQAEADRMNRTPDGQRHEQNYKSAFAMGQLVGAGVLNESEAYSTILDAALSAGRNREDAERTTRDGMTAGTHEPRVIPPPKPRERHAKNSSKSAAKAQRRTREKSGESTVEAGQEQADLSTLNVTLAERIRPFELRPLPADIATVERYISNADMAALQQHVTMLIKSDIGTGKTELIKRLIEDYERRHGFKPSVLVITHRESLARDMARRLDLECYKDFAAHWLKSAPQLVICYNSLPKLHTQGKALPRYDLVVIDECEQFHAHLDGETFRGGEAKLCYEIARQLVKTAGQVICLDAHATTISRDWLVGLRGQCTTIVNTYTRQHNPLTFHAERDNAVQRAIDLIDANEGTVVIPTGSKKFAKELFALLTSRYGEGAGYLISRDNSGSKEAQEFIQHINTRLSALRFFIYTPSLGSGVDITIPVRATVGFFGINLTATDILQMMGRCRETRESHVYVPCSEGWRAEDWQAICELHIKRVQRTGMYCSFNENGVLEMDAVQLAILKLLSMLEAEGNRSKNNLLGHAVALAQKQGYSVAFCDDQAPQEIGILLTETARQMKRDWKAKVIPAHRVSHEEYRQHIDKGTVTEEVRAGYERFKIEDAVGLDITETIFDDLHTPKQREELRRFTDLQTEVEVLKVSDRAEAQDGHLLNKRKHRLMHRVIGEHLINAVFVDGLNFDGEMTGEDIAERMGQFNDLHSDDLHTYLGKRFDTSANPIPTLRWVLRQFGVKLLSRQVRTEDGQREMLYSLDENHLDKWQGYAEARLAHLATKQAEREKALSKNLYIDSPSGFRQVQDSAYTDDLEAIAQNEANIALLIEIAGGH